MNADFAALARGLMRNLAAGTRLALFLPVRALDFRVSATNFAALAAFNILIAAACSYVRNGEPGYFDYEALPTILGQFALVLAVSLVVAWIYRRDSLLLALATALVASDWLFEAAGTALHLSGDAGLFDDLPVPFAALSVGYLAWAFAVMVRALVVVAGWQKPRSMLATGALAAMFLAFVLLFPRAELWVADEEDPEDAMPAGPSIIDEPILHRQQTLLDERLDALEPERPGVADLYFVGVAPYAPQDVFVRELASVQRLFDARFGTEGRSLVLANSPATLAETPIATATNLRAALAGVARVMNRDEDVLFLFLTSHGDARHALAFSLPPLALDPLTPTALARMLHDAGIKWKVIVVSACYSGGFVEPLRDQNTVVITASDERSTSFGCENGRDYTWFGKAFFDEALRQTHSFAAAFETARELVGERERRERVDPSRPQIFVGNAIREKLRALEARLGTVR
jgi:hypothetical protein